MKLVRTSTAAPEQYDLISESGQRIGYMRLRHGYFSAHAFGPDGPEVYHAHTEGDGIFDSDERDGHLASGLGAILLYSGVEIIDDVDYEPVN